MTETNTSYGTYGRYFANKPIIVKTNINNKTKQINSQNCMST